VVKSFRDKVTDRYCFLMKKSHIQPDPMDTNHMKMYGTEDQIPFWATLNLRTSFMYLGRSVTMVKKPQSCPICAAISARRGPDVKMAFHGTARFFRLTCTATISSVPSFPVPLLTNVLLEVLFFGVADERVRLRVGIAEHHPEKHPQDGDGAEHVKHRRPVFGHRDEGATQRISNNGTDLAAGENQSTDLGALVDGYPVGQEHVESWEGGTFT
jgi:hypothetical protein